MTSFIKSILSQCFIDKWQWLFRVENSVLWEITPFFMTKEQFSSYVEDYNSTKKNKIVEFKKANPTKTSIESVL
jgi:hypothetical protein